MTSKSSRRNVLKYLGLAGAASAAMCTEELVAAEPDVLDGRCPKISSVNWDQGEHVIKALQRLIEGIRNKDINVVSIKVDSTLTSEDWLSQNLHINFELLSKETESG